MMTQKIVCAKMHGRKRIITFDVIGYSGVHLGQYTAEFIIGALGPNLNNLINTSNPTHHIDTVLEFTNGEPYKAFLACFTPLGDMLLTQ